MKEISVPITMTSKGTFTLPAKLRKQFGLNSAGDRLMLSYRPGSRTAKLMAPVDIRELQQAIDSLIPAEIPPLKDVREYIQNTKLDRYRHES